MDKYSLSRSEACNFLGISAPTLTSWIRSGRLQATRKDPSKTKSPYLITRQACIAALNNPIHTVPVSADSETEELKCQSSAEVKSGTRVTRNQAASALRKALGQRTRSKLRSCTTNERQNSGE
ncbi:TPA: helix-turn-helix domain-containing protein [Serratia marcescens]|nr:helix-turn-helix domain-containing protein [Serratia marcescens]